uniref:Chromatin modification-related protein MEAF6 n=1 Tax=Calcidiscus leptoporus TaxID=127549 RepID=A0A7S0II67_9EUKA|mmetsp:Transcript_10602/g.24575  ORF Transcript_10602/g.24575 Transcript_10602/m.24575 type:complete len:125 (+) Transcript_10602:136-510(+)|eukprot:CAMPEP_0119380070 /NCGR_PEP_ID=MMETSP1334-20130426/55381_1 /TAXON_ID=127549 /ORGANISM="Calcidiscus leptoporus, Strain RCC1130" /LENGTH=124 /DNA_ID=CAMNT_0007399771 /DNA_START=119 /DNA_END=493 /DNA_ORIENTATION=+
MASQEVVKLQERKASLEEELARTERQIYELEGEYLQETVKDGNILRGWEGYLGKQASSGAIRRINRFREADRMFSSSSVTSSGQSGFVGKKASTGDAASSSGANAKIKKLRKRAREESQAAAQE